MFLFARRAASLLVCLPFLFFCFGAENIVASPVEMPLRIVTDTIPSDTTITDAFLENILKQDPFFDSIINNRKAYIVQIIYSQVDRGANGIASLKTSYFNVNTGNYFYPASTVKLPVCMLALQRLNELNLHGLDKNTTMITEQAYSGQTAAYNDPTTLNGKPSIAQYIKKILMVSDNDAFNRLYEFLGQDYINDQLHKKGYGDAEILHRLERNLSADENRHTNPVKFLDNKNAVIYQQPMLVNTKTYSRRNDFMGNAFYKSDQLVDSPVNFSAKNRLSLPDLHNILLSLIFPNKVTATQRFNLTPADQQFLLKYMSQLPTESTFPPYANDTAYSPAYGKFLLFGATKDSLPKNIRIFNKEGDAYGQLTDVSYIVDFDKKIEFFLSATIYCNKDGVLNDDEYDYDDTGLPFMQHLGQALYNYELKREKKIQPDLSNMIFGYDREN